jgi:hypothetical protein
MSDGRLFTASWSDALAEPQLQPVRISVGCPGSAKHVPLVDALAPFGIFGKDLPADEFRRRYLARLDHYGVKGIRERLERVASQHPDRPLALCCFERDPAACHRALFARWWEERTGEHISEWSRDVAQLTLVPEGGER